LGLQGYSKPGLDSLAFWLYNKHMNKINSQVSDLKQAIHLLDQAAKLMYNLDVRLSDYNAVQSTIASLESDVTDLLTDGQV